MKKVILLGFAMASRMQAPLDALEFEIWGCNEGYVAPPFQEKLPIFITPEGKPAEMPYLPASEMKLTPHRWFQIHHRQVFTRADNHNDPHHFQWLKEVSAFPIYMQAHYQDIPRSERYPIEAISERFGGMYFTSTFSYMVALAIHEGFDWIGCYGFEMATGSEYAHQRPNAEYLIGWARGMGVHIQLPENSNLLRGRAYGFEDDSIGMRQQLELRHGVLQNQFQKVEQEFFTWQGKNAMLEEIRAGAADTTEETLRKVQTQMINSSALANTVNGARKEVELMIQIFDAQSGAKAVEDGIQEEIK